MNLKQYQKETLRTFAYRKQPLNEGLTDMLHCAIGFSTEVGELMAATTSKTTDIINIAEEIADQMWYISNLANFINYDLYTNIVIHNDLTKQASVEEITAKLVILQGDLLDIFKKVIFYGKELDANKLIEIINYIVIEINNLSNCLEFNLPDLLDKNIAKLRVRFPDKFISENALNRNLNEERKTLES